MWFVNELCTFLFIATVEGRFVHSHQRCYACSNIDSSKILAGLQDRNWREWLSSANREPHGLTDECLDEFTAEVAIRSGARSTSCQNGTCLKLTINEFRGPSYVWRSCIPDSSSYVRSDCTKVKTKSGELHPLSA
ncbi:hypothetical protein M3Y99_01604600 [Aphelenchoides fujianensis]|nr:hypothetical protein M3Y99_01604600 [Aphelenchoides fujianensis]